jgi:hypothetical protein
MDPGQLDQAYHVIYPEKAYHTLYFGEIAACYELPKLFKRNRESMVVRPFDKAVAFDMFSAGCERNTEDDTISHCELLDMCGFNKGPAQADIAHCPAVHAVVVRK